MPWALRMTEQTISLQVNGEARTAPAGLSLDRMLEVLGYQPRLVVVEFNGTILQIGRAHV